MSRMAPTLNLAGMPVLTPFDQGVGDLPRLSPVDDADFQIPSRLVGSVLASTLRA